MKSIVCDEEKHKKRRPLPLTNISLTEKVEKNFEGMSRTSYQK